MTSVLYVDDDEDARTMVSFILEQANIDVCVAETPSEAWELATEGKFDVFLLDGLLEGGNGLDLCRRLHDHMPETPIVFYSGLAFAADIKKGMAAGATAYLVKPYGGDLAEAIMDAHRQASESRMVQDRLGNLSHRGDLKVHLQAAEIC